MNEQKKKNILILGANSGMARALERELASPKVQLVLAGRKAGELEKSAKDLEIRGHGPCPIVISFNALETGQHEQFLYQVLSQVETLDEVYLFFGQLYTQAEAQKDFSLAREMIMTNYVGAVSILELVAACMEKRGRGMIIGVSSVAGDRGRQSNYLYGSSKAGLTVYLQGLRNRLARSGVHVLTVKPGFVDTPMTRNKKKGMLFTRPEVIAQGMLKAVRARKNMVYLPGFWKYIMLIIRSVPESVFKKLKM